MTPDGLDFGLDSVRNELRALAQAATGPDGQPHEGHGEAGDGIVRVTVVGGRISQVEINPRAMRLASQELGEAFMEAANKAMDDLAAKLPSPPAANVDLAALEAQLAQAQQEGITQLHRYNQAVTDALSRLER